jgi:hypothetical protein
MRSYRVATQLVVSRVMLSSIVSLVHICDSLTTTTWRRMGEWRYDPTHYSRRRSVGLDALGLESTSLTSNGNITDDEQCLDLFQIGIHVIAWNDWENSPKTWLRIIEVQDEVRTKNLSNNRSPCRGKVFHLTASFRLAVRPTRSLIPWGRGKTAEAWNWKLISN